MLTEEELQQIPLIDTHVHRVHPDRAPLWGNLGGGYIPGPGQETHGRQTLLHSMITEALRKRFGLPEEATSAEVELERNCRYGADPQRYYADMMDESNVAMHCLEIGSPMGGAAYSEQERAYFNASIPGKKRANIVRLDRVADELFPMRLPFEEFFRRYLDELQRQIAAERAVGLKSCAAYYGGLDVCPTDREQARGAYERIRAGGETAQAQKLLRSHLLLESIELAALLDLPVQLHTGFGGGSWIEFRTMDPLCLVDFLQDPRVKNRVRVVLLHGGHPYEENAGYLVSQFSNVYSDFSGAFYLSTIKGVERMAALLERAPLDKIMYGSDGVMFPDISWFAHGHFRRQLARLLNQAEEEGYLTARRARETARMFCYDNALDCYTKLRERLSD